MRTVRLTRPDSPPFTLKNHQNRSGFCPSACHTTAESPPHKARTVRLTKRRPTRNLQVSGGLAKHTGGQSVPQGRTVRRGQKAPLQKHSVSGGLLSHHCGQSAQRARTVRRGLRGSNQKHKVSGAHSGLTCGQSALEARTVRSSPEPRFQKIFKLAVVSFEIRARVSPHANYQLYDL